MKRKSQVLVSLICTASLFFSFSLAVQASPGKSASHRFFGEDRFETSTSIANTLDAGQQVQNIVLASAHNFPDALSASTLAFQLKAPIILVSPGYKDSLMSYNYVKEHLVTGGTVTIVGGNGIISHSSEQWLLNNGFHINRLGGEDRFATNALIVNQLNVAKGTPVILASGTDFPDALGISSLAASRGWPILLSNSSNLTQSVQNFLTSDQPTEVYVVGGKEVMHNGLLDQIQTLSPNSQIQRLGGADRFETLAQILNKFYPNPTQIYVANGFDFADALSGSTLAASQGSPILLVNPRSEDLPKSIEAYLEILRNNKVQPQVNVLGGEGAVSERLVDKINQVLQNGGETTTTTSALTVRNSSTTGFIVAVNPAVDDLKVNNFTLLNSSGDSVTITSATALDDGKAYALTASLTAGQIYTLTATKEGHTFGTAQNVVVPTTNFSETLTINEPSTTGFSVTVNPALYGLNANHFILLDGNSPVTISSVTTSGGATYKIGATLAAGHTYTVTVAKNGYYFGTAQSVVVPSAATVSNAVISNSRYIVLTMSSALTGSLGNPVAFKVTGVASTPTVTNIAVSGTKVTLTLSSAIVSTDSNVLVSYDKTGSYDLSNGAPVANFSIQAVNE
ncbi:cell wall-binding repeat-containing protein [Desulfitobacterium sp.]|uniref:cell wall-binding repeat-containing protein n=1 Tax=Desulfitobacterium sp. TaxID=49981 RepID=UPI002CD15222|nr:cell wall-binding repeat-containing protein [Desulfitobacterium sp.]HVJ48865.1 cell wall-binding repeat-containing protein [Desulfitobacterium sp.]